MAESTGGLQATFREALSDVDALRAKKSNAGALLDDEEKARVRGTEAAKGFELTKEETRPSSSSSEGEGTFKGGLELPKDFVKMRKSTSSIGSSINQDSPRLTAEVVHVGNSHEKRSGHRKEKDEESQGAEIPTGSIKDMAGLKTAANSPAEKIFPWDLALPSDGEGPAVTVQVAQEDTCQTVCGAIREVLGAQGGRAVLRDRRSGKALAPKKSSRELRALHKQGFLELRFLQGNIVSDQVVDGLVEFYERHIPIAARDSQLVFKSLEDVELAVNGNGTDKSTPGKVSDDGGPQLIVENQLRSIRAELSSDLVTNGGAVSNPGSTGKVTTASPSRRSSSRTTAGHVIGGDKQSKMGDESRAQEFVQLRQAVQRRQVARPRQVEEQMHFVSKSVGQQLNSLLEEAQDELGQLEQGSAGDTSDNTFSTTDGDCIDRDVV